MAKFTLVPFNLKDAPSVVIHCEIHQNNESLFLSFRIREGLELVQLGTNTPNKQRVIKLWEKTCFEFFLKNEESAYVEFNFSAAFEWNCFYFKRPGEPLCEWEPMQRPDTEILLSLDHFLLFTEIKKNQFPKGFFDGEHTLCAGLTSVIQDKKGQMSYWALDHLDTRPNFHHFDSFKYTF
ncbi:MAG: hypothetical protein KBD76_14355 [Bacteriovorax sp.]|nr:hypothetical protein [Bacteriovorax sp.]